MNLNKVNNHIVSDDIFFELVLRGFPNDGASTEKTLDCVCSIVKEFFDGMWNGIRKAREHRCDLSRVANAIQTDGNDELTRLYRNLLAATYVHKDKLNKEVFALPLRELVIHPNPSPVGMEPTGEWKGRVCRGGCQPQNE